MFENNKTSLVKAEKVVNEPKKPIIKKYLIKSSEIFFKIPNEIKYPIKKEPIIFIKSVP